MGSCYNCGAQLSLANDETKCDSCGVILKYRCNMCHQQFSVADDDGNKRKECKVCGYFYCPFCGACGGEMCDKTKWFSLIRKEFRDMELKQIQKIIKIIEEIKTTKTRRNCGRGVPITYAKNRIKILLAKEAGFKTKGQHDINAFTQRIDQIKDEPIGKVLTISTIREPGTYGQEYRDAFNLLVCLGKLKIEKRKFIRNKDKKEVEYQCFIRCDNESCENLIEENLIINYCPDCKKQFPLEQKYCSYCLAYKKGDNKGNLRKLKKKLTNKDVCQLYRGNFDKK